MPYKDRERQREYQRKRYRRQKLGLPTNNTMLNPKNICLNCGDEISRGININGRYMSLRHRKYCLNCLPYKCINKYPNGKICIRCGRPLTGRQRKFCSKNCTTLYWTKKRRKMLKKRAVEYKGGKCILCGYSNCIDALEFHHINPEEKEFNLGGRQLKRNNWEKVKRELDKCTLLCANCHRELHWKER